MSNRIAVSLALPDTESCLDALRRLAPRVALAELRLDLMQHYDLPRLISTSPVPLIITCRAQREGGKFDGSEVERLAILREAIKLGCAYIDVEWDSLSAMAASGVATNQLIASRHWYDHMPVDLTTVYEQLRGQAHVVKLVGFAQQPMDVVSIFTLLQNAISPVIAIAMGDYGQLTRILGPCFPACFLTYGTAGATLNTAAGQLTVDELYEVYQLQHVGSQTTMILHLCATELSTEAVKAQNQTQSNGAALHVPLVMSDPEITGLLPQLRRLSSRFTIITEPDLLIDDRANSFL